MDAPASNLRRRKVAGVAHGVEKIFCVDARLLQDALRENDKLCLDRIGGKLLADLAISREWVG